MTQDHYAALAQDLQDHSVAADREGAKRRTYAIMYGGVLPAKETFVLTGWVRHALATAESYTSEDYARAELRLLARMVS